MGVVYKAYQRDLDRTVAVKMIRGGRFADDRELERFRAEAEAAATLRHPGIVAIHQVGEEDGNHFYAMDLVEGGDLEERLGGGPMEERAAAALTAAIAEAVAYAHEKEVIHRDLKPRNILLDRDGKPHVSDFGIAKRLGEDSELTVTGAVMGSPSYMSPEQASGQSSRVRETADIYSLGAILYALLTGRPPFQAATPVKTLEQVTTQEPVPPKVVNASISIDLNTICLKCLNKTPSARYQSAGELIEDLERFLHGRPILARPVSRTESTLKWVRRNPLVSGLSMALVGMAVMAFGLVWWQLQKAKDALTEAQASQRAEISARAPKHAARHILQNDAETFGVSFSAEGDRVVTASADGRVRVYDASSGVLLQTLEAHEGLVASAVFTSSNSVLSYSFDPQTHYPHLDPNGDAMQIYTSHRYGDQTAQIWDLEGSGSSPARRVQVASETQMTAAALSPDGQWLATADWDGVVTIYDASTGTEQGRSQSHSAAIMGLDFSADSKYLVTSSEGTAYSMVMTPHSRGGSSTTQNEAHLGHVLKVPGLEIVLSIPNKAYSGLKGVKILSNLSSSRSSARFHPDGRRVVTTGKRSENNALWDVETGKRLARLKGGHTHSIYMASFSPNGEVLATAGADHTAALWDASSGDLLITLEGHGGPVLWTEFSPDSRLLVTASGDGTARVWSVQQGVCVAVLKGHSGRVYRAHFSPDGLRVATASEDGSARIWDAASMDFLARVFKHDHVVLGMAFADEGSRFTTRARDGVARVWQADQPSPVLEARGLPELESEDLRRQFVKDTLVAGLTADASRLISLTEERKAEIDINPILGLFGGTKLSPAYTPLRVWDVETGRVAHAYAGINKGIASVGVSASGRWLAAGQDPNVKIKEVYRSAMGSGSSGSSKRHEGPTAVWVWDLETGELVHELPEHKERVEMVRFSPDEKLLISADREASRLWDVETGELELVFEGAAYCYDGHFFADGRRVLLQGHGKAGLWSLKTGEQLTRFEIHGRLTDVVRSVVSPDGKMAACMTRSETLYLCDVSTGKVLRELAGHDSEITGAAFHPSGKWLATSSKDKTVMVWDPQSGSLVRRLEGHKLEVTSVTFSPDGRWLGSTSRDFTARLWPVRAF